MAHCDNLPPFIQQNYVVREWRHACAILENDFPAQWDDIIAILTAFRIYKSHIMNPGKNKSEVPYLLDKAFVAKGWQEKKFETAIEIDSARLESPTHKVDCVKGQVGLEIEWNNKDPFYDRDLNNFRLLFDLRAISVGVIVTKSMDLAPTLQGLGVWSKYGASTTWYETKLLPRLEGGSGGGCPILVFAMKAGLYDPTK